MASRQLRKLRKQQELLSSQNEAPETKDESSEEEEVVVKPRPNMFSFAALGDMGDGNDDDDDEDEDEEPEPPKPVEEEVASPQAQSAKKKSKKKKKKKGKQSAETPAPEPPKVKEDEIEKALKELNIKGKNKAGRISATNCPYENPDQQLNELFKVDFRHLKAANEMRRLFGKAMDLAQVEEHQENRQRTIPENVDLETYLSATAADPRRPGQPAKAGMFETLLRTNPFIEGKKSWPRGAAQGLTMKRLSDEDYYATYFTFSHEKAYDDLERTFFQLVQMGDPMQIIHFLHQNPYHVSSLIQGSKVARQDQNSALAADLIERALFTFGRVTLSEFRRKLEQGRARIEFRRPENRQFYLAGHNLIQKLILKGTYRTALEWAKLFLSLNHDDPYALCNWIPILALRSREAQWYINFCDASTAKFSETVLYYAHTLPLAYLQLDDYDTAHEILVKNIETLPWLYCALFSDLSLDTPQSIWGHTARNDDDKLYTELYLHINKDLWNNPNAISLLKSAGEKAKKLLPQDVQMCPQSPTPTLSVARWIYLDNTPSLMSLVPRKMLHNASPNFEFDPLPPAENENIFSSETQKLPWRSDSTAGRGPLTIDPRREAGMRAVVERLLGEMPEEELDELMQAENNLQGRIGLMDVLNAVMGRVMPGAARGGNNNAGDGAQEQEPRAPAPFQATVEDGDDDDWGDGDNDEYPPQWETTTRHPDYDEDDGEGVGWTEPEDLDGEGAFGQGPSIAEVMQYMRMRVGYPRMPGAWMSDGDEDEDGGDTDTSDEMPDLEDPEEEDEIPALEDPEEVTRAQGLSQGQSGDQSGQSGDQSGQSGDQSGQSGP
ncbi:transcriptional repressor TCF25-domain-containing protein [Triangularia verruculosa]|uniref:Transcriptional repressor TCF25-domain-containing protein n=1 Tax=Triangularia verruculosa TaxID=2587418 RepID=A0AAN6XQ28_9PEZI|nr:transcriptional repressor TCF25-domain-containing protein [Triangularia verruculosa]